MEIFRKLTGLLGSKRSAAAVTALGAAGLLLLMISSFTADKKQQDVQQPDNSAFSDDTEDYCRQTENKLRDFLRKIDGAGNVDVYLTVGTGERYIYAAEGKKRSSENNTEEEKKYVITGGSSQRSPLIETVEKPEITGAVVVCSGCGNAVVEERIYKAVSSALGLPTSKIYVTKMK